MPACPKSPVFHHLYDSPCKNCGLFRESLSEREMLAIKGSLEECLIGTNAPTVKAVATRLGVTKGFLTYHFSELTKAISEKHKQVSADRVASILNERIERAREIVRKMLSDQRSISRRMRSVANRRVQRFKRPSALHSIAD